MKESSIGSLVQLRFWQHIQNGILTVLPDVGGESLGMQIRRVFTITGVPPGGIRGDHAHRYCTQVIVCLHGRVSAVLDDGRSHCRIVLDRPEQGLLIPPGIWNHIIFESSDTVLAVFCDYPYEPEDYMRDRKEYLKYKGL
ncbi:MAG TPA: FdtA/QdtA family cupin domain-containing protein [Flavobacteriales bacterium]|nr:FdtA/QdtA family cupin domain-containing protein [Flavobacteriales bacterium]